MFAKGCPKVSLQSRLSRESYDAKFGMDEWPEITTESPVNLISAQVLCDDSNTRG